MMTDQLGRALQDVRISVMDRCNFRCPYCMPEAKFSLQHRFLPAAARMKNSDIITLSRALHSLGMRKLRITGGEPLLRKDLPELIHALKQIPGNQNPGNLHPGLEIALTTNASLLAPMAGALKQAGLDRLTISLDSLEATTFAQMSGGRDQLNQVLLGVQAAEAAGFDAIKFNCVVQAGKNEPDVLALASYFRASKHVVRFIEYMDVGSCNGWQAKDVIGAAQMHAWIHARFPLEPAKAARASDVAELFNYQDGLGSVGFISAISKPFCRSCTRARVAADGKMYTCLFAHQGHDLLPVLRHGSSADLVGLIRSIWQARTDRYSEQRAQNMAQKNAQISHAEKVEMYHIGG
jgi:GTP 3',8-cyclase